MKEIEIVFPNKGVKAIAVMLDKEAPNICKAIWDILPIRGQAYHATYSGEEIYTLLSPDFQIEMENRTSCVLPGDVAYYWDKGERMMVQKEDFSEIAIYYGRFCRAMEPDGPVSVPIFARIHTGLEELAKACRELHTKGTDEIIIRKKE